MRAILVFVTVFSIFPALSAQAADFRLGLEHGVLFPTNSSLYDNKDSVHFLGLKERWVRANGWSVESSQRLISPINKVLAYAVSSGAPQPRGDGSNDLYHLRYIFPLTFSLRYDFERSVNSIFHPYITTGLGIYITEREFERTEPSNVIEEVDGQTPIGPIFTAGLEIFKTSIKMIVELKYEVFTLKETFTGSGDNGTGGGTSLSIGATF